MAPDAAAPAGQPTGGTGTDLAAQAAAFCVAHPQLGSALGAGVRATPLSGGYINGELH